MPSEPEDADEEVYAGNIFVPPASCTCPWEIYCAGSPSRVLRSRRGETAPDCPIHAEPYLVLEEDPDPE